MDVLVKYKSAAFTSFEPGKIANGNYTMHDVALVMKVTFVV